MWLETLPLLLVCWINLAWEELGQGAQGFTTCYCFIFLCIWLLWCSLCLICNHEMCPWSMYCYTACLDCINCSRMCACLPAFCCWHLIVWSMHVSCIDSDVHSSFKSWSALSQSSSIRHYISVMYYYYKWISKHCTHSWQDWAAQLSCLPLCKVPDSNFMHGNTKSKQNKRPNKIYKPLPPSSAWHWHKPAVFDSLPAQQEWHAQNQRQHKQHQ